MQRAAGKDLSPSGRGPVGLEFEIEREVMAALHDTRRVGLVHWYVSLSSSWLEVEPPMRRLLMLRIHQWIAERVLTPRRQDGATEDLKPGGALVQSLFALVPPRELDDWRGWIRLVVVEVKRALRWPLAKRNEAWAHWLFLIPYREQVGPRTGMSAIPAGLNRSGPSAGHQSRRAQGGPERWNKANAR